MKAKIVNRGITTHSARSCKGQNCCLHNPSNHHMRTWPMCIRMDKGTLAERVCPHGIGHPDPDSIAFLAPKKADRVWLGVHGCDGCCQPVGAKR